MILLYRLIFLPALLLALPYYLMRMWRRGGYGKDFQHRFGRFRRLKPASAGQTRIWLQAVSVGEVLAVGPLIESLQKSGKVEIVLTTTTSTAYAEARKRYRDTVHSIGIFPLDFWLFSRLAWKRIRPDAIVLTESELWPEHLHQARVRQVPAYLVNARVSDTSYRRYQKVPRLAKRLLRKFSAIFAASDLDAARLKTLGVEEAKLHSTGSIKLDGPRTEPLESEARHALLDELGFGKDGEAPFILLGSSTWPGEEQALIAITQRLREDGIDLRLLLVPRHAERGHEVAKILQRQDLRWHQRSTRTDHDGDIIIYLADTTGELTRLSQVADLAFIGKSLPPNHGGQSPIDAAGLGIPVLMGPNMNNFEAVAHSLLADGAAERVSDPIALETQIRRLLANPDRRASIGKAGREWHRRNRGSSQRIAAVILSDLKRDY